MDPGPSNVLDDKDEFFHDYQTLYFQTYEQAQRAAIELRIAGWGANVTFAGDSFILGWTVEGER